MLWYPKILGQVLPIGFPIRHVSYGTFMAIVRSPGCDRTRPTDTDRAPGPKGHLRSSCGCRPWRKWREYTHIMHMCIHIIYIQIFVYVYVYVYVEILSISHISIHPMFLRKKKQCLLAKTPVGSMVGCTVWAGKDVQSLLEPLDLDVNTALPAIEGHPHRVGGWEPNNSNSWRFKIVEIIRIWEVLLVFLDLVSSENTPPIVVIAVQDTESSNSVPESISLQSANGTVPLHVLQRSHFFASEM